MTIKIHGWIGVGSYLYKKNTVNIEHEADAEFELTLLIEIV
jgi:hypothetical protein